MDQQRWQRVQEIFHAALERDAGARTAYVEETCAGDVPLRDAVLALLKAHEHAGDFLSPAPAARDSGAIAGPARSSLPPGHRVGPYLIEREIGRGGMGVIYLGLDVRLDRQVALKTLAPGLVPDERRGERLKIEARAAASLLHPAIATVFALEEIDGAVWIVSEYVLGETLRDILRRQGRLPLDHILSLACQTAEGLQAAHERGIVHRDFKPENVMVTGDGRAKILDFGLARLLTGPGHDRLTRDGTVVGTPAYMAPEQLQGQDASFAADIFAFGVVLYELATGTHPFMSSASDVAPAALPQAGPPPVPAGVDPQLGSIIGRCLQPDPRQRYARTRDLVTDLTRLRDPQSSPAGAAARTPSSEARVPRPESRAPGPRLWWWQFHQLAIAVVYASVVYPVWTLRDLVPWAGGPVLFVIVLALAVVIASLRMNLWFTSRVHAHGLARQRERLRWVLPATDWTSAVLLFSLGLAAAASHPARSSLLVGVAVASLVSSLLIEPATTEAAFPVSRRRGASRRRQTPHEG